VPGAPDPLYVRARRALLDALDALEPHLDAIVLVGAQAVYLYTADTELAVAEYTTDADLAVSPGDLADSPLIGDALTASGFTPRVHPGGWLSPDGIYLDVMVPDALAGPGTRGARLGAHGKRAARRAKGLEATLVDRERRTIVALDPTDSRAREIWIAGPAALIVAKLHKIGERVGAQDRVRDKDALDLYRLFQAVPTEQLADGMRRLRTHALSSDVTAEALVTLRTLFTRRDAEGVEMTARAAGDPANGDVMRASMVALATDLLAATEQ
jgi:hypothetical protein